MFLYNVYGVTNVSQSKAVRRVDPVSAIKSTHSVQRSPMTQYGGADQPHVYQTLMHSRKYLQALRKPSAVKEKSSAPEDQSFSQIIGDLYIPNTQPILLDARRPKMADNVEFIPKYTSRLSESMVRRV